MAKLNFKYATMNSGKTLDLIRTAYNYEENGYSVLILKPAIDTKADDKISSRVGLERKVDYLIKKDDDIFNVVKDNYLSKDCIFIEPTDYQPVLF